MKWGMMAGLTALVAAMVLYEWPKIEPSLKKERAAFVVLTALGWLLGMVLIFKPDLPGPSHLIDWVFHPVVRHIEGIGGS